jgi:hypothetical protein
MATMISTGSTLEVWAGEYLPEVGNAASIGSLTRAGQVGVVTEVLPATADGTHCVLVAWKERLHPRAARPHQVAQRDRAATCLRVVTANWLTASAPEAAR